jgi:TRAP-type C4-dicarboxylate transport system permease large subunit
MLLLSKLLNKVFNSLISNNKLSFLLTMISLNLDVVNLFKFIELISLLLSKVSSNSFFKSFFAIIAPFIVLLGILSGYFSATESAAIFSLYCLFLPSKAIPY